MAKIALGSFREAAQRDCHRALMAEFISTFFFVFTGVGSAMSADKMQLGNTLVGLFAVAIAHALVLAVTIATGLHSGVHLDPAVTIGLALGGEISIFRSILHWIDQLLASSLACFLLKYLTGGMVTPVFALGDGVGPLQGVIWEIILTFSLVFTVYATIVDPKRGSLDGLGPMLTGFVVGANALAAGPFSGGCMNPARAFGPALVSGNWTDHWVYWVGPLIGGSLGGLLYENFIITKSYVPLSNKEDYI